MSVRPVNVGGWVVGVTLAALAATLAIAWKAPTPTLAALMLVAVEAAAVALLWWQVSRAMGRAKVGVETEAYGGADLERIRGVLAAARGGDLTARAAIGSGPAAELGRAVDAALEAIAAMVRDLVAAAGELGATAEAVERDSRAVADGAARQASAVAEIGRKLKALGARSEEIGQIVELLDDVAAETNILALNAAIEASRAGTQGKGFGMVADEVRKLAERSAAATKDIGAFIQTIEGGTDDAGRTVDELRALASDLGGRAATAAAGAGALQGAARGVAQAAVRLRLASQDEGELARALRERGRELGPILEALQPIAETAQTPLGAALRQVLGALGGTPERPDRTPLPLPTRRAG